MTLGRKKPKPKHDERFFLASAFDKCDKLGVDRCHAKLTKKKRYKNPGNKCFAQLPTHRWNHCGCLQKCSEYGGTLLKGTLVMLQKCAVTCVFFFFYHNWEPTGWATVDCWCTFHHRNSWLWWSSTGWNEKLEPFFNQSGCLWSRCSLGDLNDLPGLWPESVRFDFRVPDISLSSSGFLSAASLPVKRNGIIPISALRCFKRVFFTTLLRNNNSLNSLHFGSKALR